MRGILACRARPHWAIHDQATAERRYSLGVSDGTRPRKSSYLTYLCALAVGGRQRGAALDPRPQLPHQAGGSRPNWLVRKESPQVVRQRGRGDLTPLGILLQTLQAHALQIPRQTRV